MSKQNEIKLEAQLTRHELVNHLHALADSFAAGRVVIEQGTRVAVLEPGDRAEIEIEAEQKKGGKNKLTLALSWTTGVTLSPSDTLRISGELPPEPPPPVQEPAAAQAE